MAKKRKTKATEAALRDRNGLSRRDFVKTGAAVGLGAAVLSGPALAQKSSSGAEGIIWDYEADIVVLGAGATGLPAAIRARDLGASVIVLEQNFDVGGRMIHSGGWVSLGGGDVIQERDRMAADPDKMGLAAPLVPLEDLEDDPDTLFRDTTDWSVVDESGVAEFRRNDRDQQRAHADNAAAVRRFLVDNYVRFARIDGTHTGGGMDRARAARTVIKLADVTDIRAGTISAADLGSKEEERSSHFNPSGGDPDRDATEKGAPGWFMGGFTLGRYLEFSAREKGVQFVLNRHMDEIIREQPFSGRVVGVKASYTPRVDPETGERLESYAQNGNIDERAETIYVRARKGVIIGTGGHHENPVFRAMFDARLSDPSIRGGGRALMGPRAADASGIIGGMHVGAALAGLMQSYQHPYTEATFRGRLGSRELWDALFPGHPTFSSVGARGLEIGSGGWEHVIAVNQVGQRFYNESTFAWPKHSRYPAGSAGTRDPFTPLDWRNAGAAHIRESYKREAGADAAMAINEGSRAPDYWSGPVWAVFDSAAVERGGWKVRYPYIADPPDGYFVQADTLAELARKVMANEHQMMPLKYLEETVARYNQMADAGADPDFEKPVMHRIDTPPFYAGRIPLNVHESLGGLSIDGKSQVKDLSGHVIRGLYAGGEASGGGFQHGLGRATVQGYIAATNAVNGTV